MTTLIEIDSTPSTNTLMKERADTLPDGSVIIGPDAQTADADSAATAGRPSRVKM